MRRTVPSVSFWWFLVVFLFFGVLYFTIFARNQISNASATDPIRVADCLDNRFGQCSAGGLCSYQTLNSSIRSRLCGGNGYFFRVSCSTSSLYACYIDTSPRCAARGTDTYIRNMLCYDYIAPAPPCGSIGGVCQYYNYSCGAGGSLNGSCGSSYLKCCRPLNDCERAAGTCVGASSGGVGPCPSGMSYNTSISCGSDYRVCCAPNSPPPSGGSNPVGTPCNTPQGSGVCRDRNVTACSGGSYVPGYCPGGTNIQCCVPAPRYNITGSVFVDTDRDGNPDGGEAGYSRTVSMSGAASASTTSNSNGDFAFNSYLAGNYTISISVPAGYAATIPNPPSRAVSIGPNRSGINFGIVPLYSLSGSVFNDLSKNHLKEAGETKDWSGNISITKSTSDGNLSIDHDAGTYTITNLFAGTYTITYNTTTTPVPAGYDIIWPRPTAWQVTVGHNCPSSVRTDDGHICTNGNLSNVNFAISNSRPWVQVFGFNIRLDSGFTSKIPVSPWYPRFASVADNESAISNLVTPTPTRTPTPTPTRTPTPTPTRTPTPTQPPPNWGNCTAAGRAGVCYDRNTTPCGTYYDAGNYCPGGNSVQCCVNSQVSCRSTGRCHNRYANSGGNIYNCTQNWYSGYCPGPFDVQCCAP